MTGFDNYFEERMLDESFSTAYEEARKVIMEAINYSELDVGVQRLVRKLREQGFETTDSGDGSKYPEMECAFPFPNIHIQLNNPELGILESKRLLSCLDFWGVKVKDSGDIQLTYSPVDGVAFLSLYNVTDKDLE